MAVMLASLNLLDKNFYDHARNALFAHRYFC